MHSDHFTIPDHTGCLITLSDRNGPSCPSLSDFNYILDLLSADFDFKIRCTLILSVLGPFSRPSMSLQPMHSDHFTIPDHTGCLITLSDRNGPSCPSLSDFNYILDLLSADFDFKIRCTLILSVLGPFSRPSMSLQPILTLYFDALGPFRTRTLFPPPPCLATWKR